MQISTTPHHRGPHRPGVGAAARPRAVARPPAQLLEGRPPMSPGEPFGLGSAADITQPALGTVALDRHQSRCSPSRRSFAWTGRAKGITYTGRHSVEERIGEHTQLTLTIDDDRRHVDALRTARSPSGAEEHRCRSGRLRGVGSVRRRGAGRALRRQRRVTRRPLDGPVRADGELIRRQFGQRGELHLPHTRAAVRTALAQRARGEQVAGAVAHLDGGPVDQVGVGGHRSTRVGCCRRPP